MGNKSLEYLIHTTGTPYAYIISKEIDPDSFLNCEFTAGVNHGMNRSAKWFSMFDLYIYIDEMKSATLLKSKL
jgi:hypothetical protein